MTIKIQPFKCSCLLLLCVSVQCASGPTGSIQAGDFLSGAMPTGAISAALAQGLPQSKKLDPSIPPANRQKADRTNDATEWANPRIMIYQNGMVSLNWHKGKRDKSFKVEELGRNLLALPVSAWPYGRILGISECGIRSGSMADCDRSFKHSWAVINKVLKELELSSQLWPCA